jgi:prepilin-type N-terminal cleavage/methylation domain-containing protein
MGRTYNPVFNTHNGEINMKRLNTQKGFTLVELAIVMTIIGLLIGGILKGQELMQNARITATVSQIKGYSAAMTTFKDMYQAVPGDMLSAGTRLVGCPGASGLACNPFGTGGAATGDAGDGIIGANNWSTAWGAPGTTSTGGTAGGLGIDDERYLFWSHLLLANLIGGITTDGLNSVKAFALETTHPSAKVGGGFIAGYGTGLNGPGAASQPANTGLSGTLLVMINDPKKALLTATGTLPLPPLRAAQIDRKMDDGRPATGSVQAYGVDASCFTSAATLVYKETVSLTDCGLIFKIEN